MSLLPWPHDPTTIYLNAYNVWVSALLNPAGMPARVLEMLEANRFQLVVSEPLLAELVEVLERPRLIRKYQLEPTTGVELAGRLRRRAIVVRLAGTVQICRDPDDLVIETSIVGQSEAIVTRDDDLKRDPEVTRILRHERQWLHHA